MKNFIKSIINSKTFIFVIVVALIQTFFACNGMPPIYSFFEKALNSMTLYVPFFICQIICPMIISLYVFRSFDDSMLMMRYKTKSEYIFKIIVYALVCVLIYLLLYLIITFAWTNFTGHLGYDTSNIIVLLAYLLKIIIVNFTLNLVYLTFFILLKNKHISTLLSIAIGLISTLEIRTNGNKFFLTYFVFSAYLYDYVFSTYLEQYMALLIYSSVVSLIFIIIIMLYSKKMEFLNE